MMSKKDDQKICMMIANKLSARGIRAPSNVQVSCNNGEVTLSGNVVQEHQRNAARHAAEGIQGVKRVYDRLSVKSAAKRSSDPNGQWTVQPLKPKTAAGAEVIVDSAPEVATPWEMVAIPSTQISSS